MKDTRRGTGPRRPMPGHRTAALLLAGLMCALAPGPAGAEYPERLIRLVVPQAPGSATDVLARILAAELEPQIGQSIVVENRPGGALTTGLSFTAKSEPDGYTIAMGPVGALAITRHLVKKLPYDIERDFQPIALVTRGQMLLAVSPKLPVRSVQELVALAKAKPGTLVYASSSAGSPGHVGGELFKFMTGADIAHVPYRGGSTAITDLMSGQVHMMLESLSSIAPFAQSGDVRALAVSGPRRSPAFPDCRPSTRRACRASRSRHGTASSGLPACRGPWSTSSTPRSIGPFIRRRSESAWGLWARRWRAARLKTSPRPYSAIPPSGST